MVMAVEPVLLAMPEDVMFRTASVGPLLPEPPQAAAASAIKGMAMRRMSFLRFEQIVRREVTLQGVRRPVGVLDSNDCAGACSTGRPSTSISPAQAITGSPAPR